MKRHTFVLSGSCLLRSPLLLGAPLALTLAGALSACAEAEPRELGFTQSTQDLSSAPDEPFFQDSSEFVGRWVGTAAETLALGADGSTPAYQFPSGSTRIVLDLRLEDRNLIGTLSFGEGAALPPATDPDSGYPAGVGYDALLGYELPSDGRAFNSFIQTNVTLPPFEGFAYRVSPGNGLLSEALPLQVADGVASLSFSSFEPLDGWCQLQTPEPQEAGGFSCLPSLGGQLEVGSDGSDKLCGLFGPPKVETCLPDFSNITECIDFGEPVAHVNCDKVTMCLNNFCTCDEQSCGATITDDRLTLRRSGAELVGLFEKTVFKNARGLNTPLGEVRLQRE